MYRAIRNMLKLINDSVVDIIPFNIYASIYYNVSANVNTYHVKKLALNKRLKQLKDLDYKKRKKSDKLFILGSGSSINDITAEQWGHINEHDSIGFNFWVVHDFVPTFYVYEENLELNRNQVFYNILNERKADYINTPLIVKDVEYKGLSTDLIPSELIDNIYLSTEIVIPYSNEYHVEKFLNKGKDFFESQNSHSVNLLLKKSASISYLLHLSQVLGYKEVILCGIDLNNSLYFYEHESYKSKVTPIQDYETSKVHPTNIRTESNLPIEIVVNLIKNTYLKDSNMKLYVASKKSSLHPKLDCYF
ncbi:hypothetical protein [Halalkalibacter okhensis]|uniref:Uncharacterized protein n=1 Tax=Halalkalibacter okhensis TaxID=333138 RepID=A0A0B0IGA9_9BACI|nr:hypothetical protein [Halalkalibacter okhensis]KHF38711.1 hypothetical protein LQ50_19745 [Halalkalibacter okhensis]